MKQILLILLLFSVMGGTAYTGWQWTQKQAYVVYSRQYIEEVNELVQLWTAQTSFPQSRNWLHDFYYQRRWELLSQWAQGLVNYNKELHLQGDFIQTVDTFIKNRIDFRDSEKMKFYILELKDRANRLPKSELSKNNILFRFAVEKLYVTQLLIDENQRLLRRVSAKLPDLETIFQAQFDQDSKIYCSTHQTMNDRHAILVQMKERCLEAANANLPMCQQGASYFQGELDQLQKLDQWNIDKLKQRWPQWREPACTH